MTRLAHTVAIMSASALLIAGCTGDADEAAQPRQAGDLANDVAVGSSLVGGGVVNSWISGSTKFLDQGAKCFEKTKKADAKWEGAGNCIGALGSVAAAGVGIWSLLQPKGPSIQDVLDKLDEMQKQLDQIEADLAVIDARVQQLDRDVLNGFCSQAKTPITTFKTTVNQVAQYWNNALEAQSVVALEQADSSSLPKHIDLLSERWREFTNYTLTGNAIWDGDSKKVYSGTSVTDKGTLGGDLTTLGDLMLGTQGGGIVEECSKAATSEYRARVAALSPGADLAEVAYFDDRNYYVMPLQLVQGVQNLQAKALNFIQEATLYSVVYNRALNAGDPITSVDSAFAVAGDPCVGLDALDTSSKMCQAAQTLTRQVYRNYIDQFKISGAPWSDGVMSVLLGPATTGLTYDDSVPFIAVRRHQGMKPTDAASAGKATFSDPGITWRPAAGPDVSGILAGANTVLSNDDTATALGVMAQLPVPDSDDTLFRLDHPAYWSADDSFAVSWSAYVTNGDFDAKNRPYWPGGDTTTAYCFIAADRSWGFEGSDDKPQRGYVCDEDLFSKLAKPAGTLQYTKGVKVTVGSSAPPGTISATFDYFGTACEDFGAKNLCYYFVESPLTPIWASMKYQTFSCKTPNSCMKVTGTETVPVDSSGAASTVAPMLVWDIPTPDGEKNADCINVAGVPSRCGEFLQSWVDERIPNPSKSGPQPADPTKPVTIEVSGQDATCVAPAFVADSASGPVVVSGNPLWIANGPDGANASRLGGVSGTNGNLSSIESWKVTQPDGSITDDTFTMFQLTCQMAWRYERLANVSTAVTPTVWVSCDSGSCRITEAPPSPTASPSPSTPSPSPTSASPSPTSTPSSPSPSPTSPSPTTTSPAPPSPTAPVVSGSMRVVVSGSRAAWTNGGKFTVTMTNDTDHDSLDWRMAMPWIGKVESSKVSGKAVLVSQQGGRVTFGYKSQNDRSLPRGQKLSFSFTSGAPSPQPFVVPPEECSSSAVFPKLGTSVLPAACVVATNFPFQTD